MRQERSVQASLFDLFAGHEIGRELKAMSAWLEGHRALLSLVAADLCRRRVKETGRQGLPAEAVLRCAVLKQHRQLSYQELAFHLEDSASFRAFARLPHAWSPKKSVLHQTISAIRAETWEQINRALLTSAQQEKLESGRMVRLDSTVTAALMHEPSDSSLLWDAIRVMVRLLRAAPALVGEAGRWWRDHRRAAKKRALANQLTYSCLWTNTRLAPGSRSPTRPSEILHPTRAICSRRIRMETETGSRRWWTAWSASRPRPTCRTRRSGAGRPAGPAPAP
jgi:IS5 family transposase